MQLVNLARWSDGTMKKLECTDYGVSSELLMKFKLRSSGETDPNNLLVNLCAVGKMSRVRVRVRVRVSR